ncbi:hypothetical protein CANARDRAFT_28889 [[Candida] arabinofermentans NRRL YB-2248]|uniref:C2H2-type domain-containing protein n=1 Tax=[Candida] arabinofermentans NRRL YB-2248 TaxID=983967 RepID=A0A1E4SZ20_9ASCO|nr:hypothetical protein CANARDRAFT_28889 [[Candida] arabinofermentans NRRL YB-2248]
MSVATYKMTTTDETANRHWSTPYEQQTYRHQGHYPSNSAPQEPFASPLLKYSDQSLMSAGSTMSSVTSVGSTGYTDQTSIYYQNAGLNPSSSSQQIYQYQHIPPSQIGYQNFQSTLQDSAYPDVPLPQPTLTQQYYSFPPYQQGQATGQMYPDQFKTNYLNNSGYFDKRPMASTAGFSDIPPQQQLPATVDPSCYNTERKLEDDGQFGYQPQYQYSQPQSLAQAPSQPQPQPQPQIQTTQQTVPLNTGFVPHLGYNVGWSNFGNDQSLGQSQSQNIDTADYSKSERDPRRRRTLGGQKNDVPVTLGPSLLHKHPTHEGNSSNTAATIGARSQETTTNDYALWDILKSRKHKGGSYQCSHCTDIFTTAEDFIFHLDKFKLVRSHNCPVKNCPYRIIGLPRRPELVRHCLSQHSETLENLIRKEQGLPIEAPNLQNGHPYDQRDESIVVYGGHSMESDNKSSKREHLNKCFRDGCGKKFKRKDSLQRHERLVHENKNSRFNQRLRMQRTILGNGDANEEEEEEGDVDDDIEDDNIGGDIGSACPE